MKDTKKQAAKKLPIVIIGAGGIVRDAHLPAYRKSGFKVKGIYDPLVEKAAALKKSFPEIGTVYRSMDELIKANRNEKVVYDVAVPADQHYRVLNQLPDGVPVLMQKPMGETIGEAEAVLHLCEEKQLVAEVNFQLKYAPFITVARDLINQNAIGEVFDMEMMVCVYTPWRLWSFLKTKPRVEILYHSIHYIDLIRSFLGNPEKVYASTVKHPKVRELAPTRSTIILDYDEFTQARIITNHGHDYHSKEQTSYLKIEGTKGAIKIQIGLSLDYPVGKPDRFEYISKGSTDSMWKEVPVEGTWFPDAFSGAMMHLQSLVDAPEQKRYDIIRDNYDTMRVVEAAYHSSEQGGVSLSGIE
jgi:predicted dehydrogenase